MLGCGSDVKKLSVCPLPCVVLQEKLWLWIGPPLKDFGRGMEKPSHRSFGHIARSLK